MALGIADIIIASLRGGQYEDVPPSALADDQCVLAQNVEFFYSSLGERRNGCGPLDITGSHLSDEATISHISQWFPSNDPLNPDFFAISATQNVSTTTAHRLNGVWSKITPTDAWLTTFPNVFEMVTQSLNGKFFVAGPTAQDRMHVYDGTTLRRAGLAQPAAPTGANEGAGTYASVRYFRVRYIVKSGSTILLRSEPSLTLTFTPSGGGAGVTITKPATISEGETHWELEASTDNANFYRIATTIVGTTTVNDETVFATGYTSGVLSEAIGTYLLQPSAKFLAVDGDRLITGGHWTNAAKQSQVGWTPVQADPGVGNDERLPLAVNNTVNLDNYDGGPLTGLAASAYGTWYAFKWVGIYKMVRTGDVVRAYDVLPLSRTRGAIPGSIVKGMDENGAPCIYFLDPTSGPSRIGPGGVETLKGLRTTWGRLNRIAGTIIARGCYYPYKQQMHWWLAADGNNTPNFKIVHQVSEGAGRGWSVATGRITEANAVAVLTEGVSIGGVISASERPFVGLTSPDYIQRCDIEITDAGVPYVATIRTRPYFLTGLLNKWGAMTAALLAAANASSSVVVKFLRDYSIETASVTTTLAPVGTETYVTKHFDDLNMSQATCIQVEFTDP